MGEGRVLGGGTEFSPRCEADTLDYGGRFTSWHGRRDTPFRCSPSLPQSPSHASLPSSTCFILSLFCASLDDLRVPRAPCGIFSPCGIFFVAWVGDCEGGRHRLGVRLEHLLSTRAVVQRHVRVSGALYHGFCFLLLRASFFCGRLRGEPVRRDELRRVELETWWEVKESAMVVSQTETTDQRRVWKCTSTALSRLDLWAINNS